MVGLRRAWLLVCLVFLPGLPVGASASVALANDVFEQVTAEGDVRCGRLTIDLLIPVLVIGHFPDTPSRAFYVVLKGGADRGQRRESANFARSAFPWLEGVSLIGDLPGFQLLLIEVSEPSLMRLMPHSDPRSVSVLVTTPAARETCELWSSKR